MIQTLKSKSTLAQWFLFLCLFGVFIFINAPFTMPFLLAGIFALGLHDFINKISNITKLKRSLCIVLTLFVGFAIFWIPLSLAIYRVIIHVTQPQTIETDKIVEQIKHLKDFLISNLQKISDWTGTDLAAPAQGMIESLLKRLGEIVLKNSSEFLSQLPANLLATFVFVILVFLLLLRATKIKDFVIRYSVLNPDLTKSLINVSKYSCSITLFSTLVIGLIQACIIGFGSLFFGEGDFWLILAVTFFVSFIPVIGAAPVGYLLSILAFIGGRTQSGIGLAVVATLAGSVDNILKPLLVGRENKISPIIGFTCVVGSILMIGLPGLLLGPVVMNLFAGASPLLLKNDKPQT